VLCRKIAFAPGFDTAVAVMTRSVTGTTLLTTAAELAALPVSADATLPVWEIVVHGALSQCAAIVDWALTAITVLPPAVKSPRLQVSPPGAVALPTVFVQVPADPVPVIGVAPRVSKSAPALCGIGISTVTDLAALVLVIVQVYVTEEVRAVLWPIGSALLIPLIPNDGLATLLADSCETNALPVDAGIVAVWKALDVTEAAEPNELAAPIAPSVLPTRYKVFVVADVPE
jgi:hypothetical protein